MVRMIQLEMHEGGPDGDADAERYGYWVVTGPQDPRDVSGTIDRARSFETGAVFFAWYLNRRSSPERNTTDTYMVTIAQGEAATVDEALNELRIAWQRDVGEAADDMPLVERPAHVDLPWSDV